MSSEDHLRYEARLYELENNRINYYVYVSTRAGERWSQWVQVSSGSADSEREALDKAQSVATWDRKKRAEENMKVVPLQ